MYKKYVLMLFTAIALAGCSTSKKVQGPPPTPQPDWAKSRPTSQIYYHGIGVARKTFDVNQYQQTAKQNALADMSGEISIYISTNSVIHAFESNLDFREDFSSTIKAQTQQDLEGYELVDTWEDQENYWAFYRLSKSHYQQLKEKRKNDAIARSLDFFSSGFDAREAGNIRLSIVQMVKALEPIKPYFSEPLPIDFKGSQVFLGNVIFKELSATLAAIEISPLNQEVNAKTGKGLSSSLLQFQVQFQSLKSVAEFPLIATYSEKPIRNNRKRTAYSGIASFEIDRVSSSKSSEMLSATVDLDEILMESTTDPMIRRLLARFSLPQGTIRINIEKPVFAIISNEVNLGVKQSPGILNESFRKKAIESGYLVKENVKDADYVVRINASTKATGESGAYKNAIVEGAISVETAQGNPIYHKPLEGFTGRHFDVNDAGLEALKEIRRRLEISFFREIQERLSKN